MSEQDVNTLRRTYEAFNRGDLDEVFKAFDPQIEWHELEGNPQAAGMFRGTEAVADEVFATIPENWEEFEADPHDFIDADEHIIVTGHFRGRPKGNGGTLDAHFAHVWRMRDGKAVHFTDYADTMMWARAMGKA